MGKHLLDKNKKKTNNNDNFYGRIIARQGEGLVAAKNEIKALEDRLVQERMNRIEDLRTINVLATCNCYGNEKSFLNKIAEVTSDSIKELTNANIKRKELSSNTDQSIKN